LYCIGIWRRHDAGEAGAGISGSCERRDERLKRVPGKVRAVM
jgi:hypothetical protein